VGLKFVSGALGATVRLPPTILGSVPESDEELIPSLPPSKNIACDIARLRHSPVARFRWRRVPAPRKEGLAPNCQACERPCCPMEPVATMWSIGSLHRVMRQARHRQCRRGRRSRDGVIGQATSYPAQPLAIHRRCGGARGAGDAATNMAPRSNIAEQLRFQRIVLSEGELVAPNQGRLRAIDPLLRQSPNALLQV
jgi:hypothetical protein